MSNIENRLYPVDVALSPSVILDRHQQIITKHGLKNFLTRREFKRAREMYQTAIYAVGMTAKTGCFYWVAPSKDNTPDCYLIWQQNGELAIECVEITLWNERVETMWEIIEKKINKQYPAFFSVVIHDSRAGESVSSGYYQTLHEKLIARAIPAGAVRFWTEINNNGEKNVLLGELYPRNDWTEFSANYVLSKYHLSPELIKIDVHSSGRRITFVHGDLHDVRLEELPDLDFQY